MKKIVFLALFTILLTSCISTKDLTYLQPNTLTKSDSIKVSQEVSKPYRIQTNDVISVNIKALDQKLVDMFSASSTGTGQTQQSLQTLYFNGYTVDDHGNIRLPILGELNVLGYTTDEVRQKIEKQLLEEYFKKEANIFVTVKLSGLRYTINGEINNPGMGVLYQDRATIMEAIANSGDITATGNRKEVQIIRKFAHGFETYSIDLTSENAMSSPYFYIQPNDYIIVKPLKQKSWGTGVTGMQSAATIMTAISLITTLLVLSKTL
jgi:polysaccharide export outer membrane protein